MTATTVLRHHWLANSALVLLFIFADENRDAGQLELSAAETAALLRCLVSAERLPALNYGTLCRRLLRSHSGNAELYAAVAAFAAAQGSRQQQPYHLADFAAELLSQGSQQTAPEWQQQPLLAHLPQLLAALPEAQAAMALDGLCLQVAVPVAAAQQAQILTLLCSIEQLLSSGTSPALQQAAQQVLVSALLPALPQPNHYPLVLAPEAIASAPLSLQQRCWAAGLRCLRLLPVAQLEAALQQPALLQQLPLHAAAAAAALVACSKLGASVLQHPRNLLLSSGGQGQQLGLVATLIGRAVGSLPASQQQQWLLDVLDACKVSGSSGLHGRSSSCCDHCCDARGPTALVGAAHSAAHLLPCLQACASPTNALQLAACIASSSAAAAVQIGRVAAELTLCAGTAAATVLSLPAVVPLLLDSAAWQHRGAATLLLQRLAAALQSEQQPAKQGLVQQCLLAARSWLPAEMWPMLASLL